MKLKQIRKPNHKCINCKTYLLWDTNKVKGSNKRLYIGKGDYGEWYCPNCFALYEGDKI